MIGIHHGGKAWCIVTPYHELCVAKSFESGSKSWITAILQMNWYHGAMVKAPRPTWYGCHIHNDHSLGVWDHSFVLDGQLDPLSSHTMKLSLKRYSRSDCININLCLDSQAQLQHFLVLVVTHIFNFSTSYHLCWPIVPSLCLSAMMAHCFFNDVDEICAWILDSQVHTWQDLISDTTHYNI
jgi:hypothetical protein